MKLRRRSGLSKRGGRERLCNLQFRIWQLWLEFACRPLYVAPSPTQCFTDCGAAPDRSSRQQLIRDEALRK